METTTDIDSQAIARGVLISVDSNKLVLGVAGTDYQIQLVPTTEITTPTGKRIKGTIHAHALRISKARGGGKFIEPIWGEPRIVAGVIQAMDNDNRRLLVDIAVPVWMKLNEKQPNNDTFQVGEFITCYVQSGATFTPA